MEVQPSLVLLQKTLLNIEGLGKQLYPELDLWQTAYPFLENWQKQRLSPLSNLKKMGEKLPQWLEQAPEIPELLYGALQATANTGQHQQQLEARLRKLESTQNARNYHITSSIVLTIAVILLLFLQLFPDWFHF
jgi:ubiquinone biosynthesis protein